jgi:hypothetical protein
MTRRPKIDRMMQPDLMLPFYAVRILKSSRVNRSQLVCDGDGHFLNWRDSGKIYSQYRGACSCAPALPKSQGGL